mmetsp:Transcript_38608/g.104550  ORF Transcript_38608/g.104550 Transcript_38608/m.104550 type:complete len:227 (-) Transcript_38608:269-949(-)
MTPCEGRTGSLLAWNVNLQDEPVHDAPSGMKLPVRRLVDQSLGAAGEEHALDEEDVADAQIADLVRVTYDVVVVTTILKLPFVHVAVRSEHGGGQVVRHNGTATIVVAVPPRADTLAHDLQLDLYLGRRRAQPSQRRADLAGITLDGTAHIAGQSGLRKHLPNNGAHVVKVAPTPPPHRAKQRLFPTKDSLRRLAIEQLLEVPPRRASGDQQPLVLCGPGLQPLLQ